MVGNVAVLLAGGTVVLGSLLKWNAFPLDFEQPGISYVALAMGLGIILVGVARLAAGRSVPKVVGRLHILLAVVVLAVAAYHIGGLITGVSPGPGIYVAGIGAELALIEGVVFAP